MRPHFTFPLVALLVLCPGSRSWAQNFTPKTIQFKGVPDYSDDELMAACGLKKGELLSSDKVNQQSQKLMDTGLFQGLTFTFDGQDLVFKMRPADQVFPVRLINLPFAAGPDLDGKLRAHLPLYHGRVPNEGGMLDAVRAALEDQLKAQGIANATVAATPFANPVTHKVDAISFSIMSPGVVLGDVAVNPGVVLDKDAEDVLRKLPGRSYDYEGSPRAIERYLGNVYRDKGYLDVQVSATQDAALNIAPDTVRVPFHVGLTPGPLFRVAAIRLAPDMVVTQADFDKQAAVHPGDVADAEHIVRNWEYLSRQYHNRGYMKARIEPAATLDKTANTVSYAVTAIPGPVYTMGKFTVENASDDLRTMIISAWKIPPGAPFNEGAIMGMMATQDVNPKLERLFRAVDVKYALHLNDDTRTADVVLRLEKQP